MNACEMIQPMPRVLIVYIAVKDNPLLVSHAGHFVDSYRRHPPGYEHQLLIVCNGGRLSQQNEHLFDDIPHEMVVRDNDPGWDVSAYIEMAGHYACDLQVCLGESVYFNRAGWLQRTVDCFQEHGQGMYGYFSSYLVRPHLNTTAFAVSPRYLRVYCPVPRDQGGRYEFEHGVKSLWRRIVNLGGCARLVTWDGCWEPKDWRKPDNILWRGDQSNCLVRSNHTERFTAATPTVRRTWQIGADSLAR